MNIFVCLSLKDDQLERFHASVECHELHYFPDAETNPKAKSVFDNCQVVFGNPPAKWISENATLRWIQLESVGFGEYTGLDWHTLGKRLKLSNLAGFFSDPVAESILAGVLSHYRGIGRLSTLQTQHVWAGEALRPNLKTLRGANAVLFGKGDINRRLVELLAPFGCTITSFGRGWVASDLRNALAKADIVICAVPDNLSTRGVFDHDLIGTIKQGGMFVNFGRGSLVDENALAAAVETGRLSGAVIDVTKEEPLPQDHRFWKCTNILLTQHTGGGTGDEIDRKIDYFLANLKLYLSNKPPQSVVDFTKAK
ncbi:MAG: NAD(P)-dependent oxidoreductase [Usitatibacteraceae bacterium]